LFSALLIKTFGSFRLLVLKTEFIYTLRTF
jgi:hypothetical protein